jgi:hypothetical protein
MASWHCARRRIQDTIPFRTGVRGERLLLKTVGRRRYNFRALKVAFKLSGRAENLGEWHSDFFGASHSQWAWGPIYDFKVGKTNPSGFMKADEVRPWAFGSGGQWRACYRPRQREENSPVTLTGDLQISTLCRCRWCDWMR